MNNGNSNSNDKIYSNSPLHTTVIESTPLTIPLGTVTFLWNWKPYGGSMVRPILANASGWRPHSRSLHWPCWQQWSALLRARSLLLCPAHVRFSLYAIAAPSSTVPRRICQCLPLDGRHSPRMPCTYTPLSCAHAVELIVRSRQTRSCMIAKGLSYSKASQ